MNTAIKKNTKVDFEARWLSMNKLVGNTPLYWLNKIFPNGGVQLCAKLEWQQLGHSVKTRPAYNMIRQAAVRGDLEGRRLLDASSGNTAVSLAAICAPMEIPVTLVVPENAAPQKVANLRALGAEIIFSSRFDGTDGAQIEARKLVDKYPGRYWYSDQYNNDDNWKSHYDSTGNEIYEQTEGRITHFVVGLGTSGTFVGTVRKLKELNPHVRAIALHPDLAMHGLEGWKHMETARAPGIYDDTLADDHLEVNTTEAYEMMKIVAQKEGLVLSPSSAANLTGALKVAENMQDGVVGTVFPDAGYNYPEIITEVFN